MQDLEAIHVRRRTRYAMFVAGTIVFGLASRRFPFRGKYPGDALWSLIVFLALGVAFPRAKSVTLAVLALCISVVVEFLKLDQSPWLVSLRQTTFGHLVFGRVFSWENLVAYAVGVCLGLLLECRTRIGFPVKVA